MPRWIFSWAAALCAVGCVACSGGRADATVAAATPDRTIAAPPAAQAPPAAMEHGDHNPHHGGVVYMYDDMHYEVVLDSAGHHRVYFTDSAREDLPASLASTVTLSVERRQAAPETISGTIDGQGESWVLDGQPLAGKDTNIRVSFIV